MIEVLLPTESPVASRSRLERAGFRVGALRVEGVPGLDAGTAERVVVIPAVVFMGSRWPRLRVELARRTRQFVVEVMGKGSSEVVAAMRDGAFDVVSAEEPDARWREAIEGAAASQRVWLQLYAGRLDVEGQRLVGVSAPMQELRRDLERLGPTDVSVLLLGESGVGKERVSAALHETGRGGPMVTLNCAAMPRELIEAELFGAEKGSFTGAVRSRPGLVEQADGGTLFLDEVGELDPAVQPKLLRFLETRKARRVGGEVEYSVKVRVVAATNRDLEREVQLGRFRADLFYRLAEVVLRIPPLRARKDDIPDLVRAFVSAANERFGKNVDTVEPELLVRLRQYAWPGNIRELKGVIDRLVLFHDGPVLRSGWWEPPVVVFAVPEPGAVQGSLMSGRVAVGVAAPDPARAEVGGDAFPGTGVVAGGGSGMGAGAVESESGSVPLPALPGRAARLDLARRLLDEGRLTLGEVAARVGIHPTTLFRWRKSGKAGGNTAGADPRTPAV